MSARSVFFYVQHLLGIGHLRRAAAIGLALRSAGLRVVFVSGGEPIPGLDFGDVATIQLPPARSGDGGFGQIVDAAGRPIDDAWRAARRAALLDAFARSAPDILLIELFPFGRRPFRFELLPLLDAAGQSRPRPVVACSVRDILVGKNDPRRTAETVDLVQRQFDLVLVHGDPRLVRFEATFPGTAAIADRLRYTGYVVSESPAIASGRAGQGEVLVSAGGGAVGAPLLRAALAARPLSSLAATPWRLITGLNLREAIVDELRAAAPAEVVIERFRADFQSMLRNCRLSVSQAGYNTVMELLAAGARSVVVPFAENHETEQPLRARLLAERGLLTLVEPAGLSPMTLAAAIDAADGRLRQVATSLNFDGAAQTARILATAERTGAATSTVSSMP